MGKLYRIALIGRSNVGKSTLWNRLIGRSLAIIHNEPGVTRNQRDAVVSRGENSYSFVDTPGFEETASTPLFRFMWDQTQAAIESADLLLVIFDGQDGLTAADHTLMQLIRTKNKPQLFLINKCEGKKGHGRLSEFYQLGIDTLIPISAEHNEGMGDLWSALQERCKSLPGEIQEVPPSDAEIPEHTLRLAIIGRPNVGKSTLINKITNSNRLLTGDIPGVTRDAIDVPWTLGNTSLVLTDTAGVRKQARISSTLERITVKDAFRAVQFSHVVVLLVDAHNGVFDRQDLNLARYALQEGRCLVVGLNKWDTVPDKSQRLKEMRRFLEEEISNTQGVPLIPLSGKTGENLPALMKAALDVAALWNTRIPTAKLNVWLQDVLAQNPPPLMQGHPIKIKYMTQIKKRPPTFALFLNSDKVLPSNYERYLANALRQTFSLFGIPIRFVQRN